MSDMETNGPDMTTEDRVRRLSEATDWLLRLRLHDGDADETTVNDWLSWYEGDERHRQVFDEMQALWTTSGRLATGALGAARIERLREYELPLTQIEMDRRRPPRPTRRSGWHRMGLAAACLCGLAAATVYGVVWFAPTTALHAFMAGASAPPVLHHMKLPDGSAVDLAGRSDLVVDFTPTVRKIQLRAGEAYFSVAPNHAVPFVVSAAGISVRAVGTRFNVREASNRVVVTVTEGAVDVYPAAKAGMTQNDTLTDDVVRLRAGHSVTWSVDSGDHTVRAADETRLLAWREGRLEYVNEPLSGVLADVGLYTNLRVIVQDVRLSQLTYTGTVLIGSLEEWLRALPREFPVQIREANGALEVIALPRSTAAPTTT